MRYCEQSYTITLWQPLDRSAAWRRLCLPGRPGTTPAHHYTTHNHGCRGSRTTEYSPGPAGRLPSRSASVVTGPSLALTREWAHNYPFRQKRKTCIRSDAQDRQVLKEFQKSQPGNHRHSALGPMALRPYFSVSLPIIYFFHGRERLPFFQYSLFLQAIHNSFAESLFCAKYFVESRTCKRAWLLCSPDSFYISGIRRL